MDIAIIGTGFAAGAHARNLTAMGERIAAVVDTDARAAKAFAESWGAGRYSDSIGAALENDIDAVHICTPPAFHGAQARAALLAGKNVVCEKPLCTCPAEALELARLAKERGLINAVCFNVRFYDACEQLRGRLAGGEAGALCLAHGEYLQEFHALPDAYTWRYRPEQAGPMRAVTEIGSHWFDMLRYVTGEEVASVSAQFGAFSPERRLEGGVMYPADGSGEGVRVASEDAAAITFRLSGGALGNVLLSEVSHGRTNRLTVELCGRDASLWWDSEDPYKLSTGRKGRGVRTEVRSFADGFDATFRALFADIYSGGGRHADFMDGYENARICEAVYKSAMAGGLPVEVDGGEADV